MNTYDGSNLKGSSVLLIGATGFIGRYLVSYMKGKGCSVIAGVRDVTSAPQQLGQDVKVIDINGDTDLIVETLEEVETVINLAGRQLAGVRWTKKRKAEFGESRIGLNKKIVKCISLCEKPPTTFLTASAVGVYGDSGRKEISEQGPDGTGYLADMCRQWEDAANEGIKSNVRVISLRLGIVLNREGGMLNQLTLPFEMGVGSYIGDGKQIVPWIHLKDVLRMIDYVISNREISGPVNCTAPNPITAKFFAETLKRNTAAKLLLPLPKIVLKILFGEGAGVLTNSQNAIPKKALDTGFHFTYEDINSALQSEFDDHSVDVQKVNLQTDELAPHSEKTITSAQYRLKTQATLNVSTEKAFKFFHSPANLGLCTPPWLKFSVLESSPEMGKDSMYVYQIKLGPIPLKWTTRIIEWTPDDGFIDLQENGPYKLWVHKHQMKRITSSWTEMEDTVHYSLPFGPIGKLAHNLIIKKVLKRIFSYRNEIIKLRFGEELVG